MKNRLVLHLRLYYYKKEIKKVMGNNKEKSVESVTLKVEIEIFRVKSMMQGISGVGYDALFAILELKTWGGEIWWFYEVPEHVWYAWRNAKNQTAFFDTHIAGKYQAERIEGENR